MYICVITTNLQVASVCMCIRRWYKCVLATLVGCRFQTGHMCMSPRLSAIYATEQYSVQKLHGNMGSRPEIACNIGCVVFDTLSPNEAW